MKNELQMTNGIPAGKSADRCRTMLSPHSAIEIQHSTFPQDGSMALLLANGSMSSNSSGEGDIRRALIEADLVETASRECASLNSEGTSQVVSEARNNMVVLPGQLFTNTQSPACIWFLTRIKHAGSELDVSNLELALAA